jgi:type I restriction enzyme S subunit
MREQATIVSILSAYDDLIENNRRRIALLEEAAQQLYKEWFVRFRFPGHEHVKLVDGVPEGWEVKEIGDVADNVSYGYTASADPDIEGPKFLRITDIVRGQISWPDVPRCPIDEHKLARFELAHGDVVVARTGATTGWARRVGRMQEAAVFASYLVRFRFGSLLHPTLAAIFMESETYKANVWASIGGAAQPNASAQLLAKPKLVVPTKALQHAFAEEVSPNLAMIDVLMEQIDNLSRSRDLLLPRLMNGTLTV